ncbi:MAG TPA: glycosyltransferase family 4 protein [Thermoanaerobaculia bacterium]
MKVAIVSCVYPPEPAVSARTSFEIAEALRDRGDDVTVICPFPNRPGGRVFDGFRRAWRSVRDERGVRVERRWSTLSRSSTLISRFVENVTFGITSAIALRRAKPDIAYLNSWPLFATALAVLALGKTPFVVSVQDVYPESLFVQRRSGARVIGALLRRIDRWIAKRARAVIVLSRGFAEIYERDRGVAHVHVIPNWITDDIAPDPEAGRAYRRERGIPDDAFLVVYGGNVGVAANVEQLIEATRTLDVHLLIAGSGPRVAACRAISHERVHFEDPWPMSMTAAVLSAADLLALPTLGEQSFVSVPSKLLTYLLMDKPILAIAPQDSEIARVIADANAGRTVQDNIADAIRTTRGGGGRKYVLREFSRDACLPRILELLR